MSRRPDDRARPAVHGERASPSIDADRQLLVAENGLYVRDVKTGALTLHTPIEADNPATRSNDSRVHPSGAFWIGTMAQGEGATAGAIYWFCKGEVRKLFAGVSIPNSICFSPTARPPTTPTSPATSSMRVDCDPATGLPTGEPKVFVDQRQGKGWARRLGGRRRRRAVERALGRRARRRLCARRQAAPLDRRAGEADLLPGLRRPERRPHRGHLGLEGHGRRGARPPIPHAGKTFLLDVEVRGRFEPRVLI